MATEPAHSALSLQGAKTLLTQTWSEFNDDECPRLGAALAFYTVLSLAPLLILLIALAGLVFGEEAAQGTLFEQINDLVGPQGAEAVESAVQNASRPGAGIIASVVGFLTLMFAASGVANELKRSFNQIWDVPPPESGGVTQMIKQRSSALAVVLGCGFLLLVSLAVSSVLVAAGRFMTDLLPMPAGTLHTLNIVLSMLVITGVFAFMFRFLPDVNPSWGDVFLGAGLTAVLFTIGKTLIGIYLGQATFTSTYGAAGSLVVLLVWIYYSSQIVFFGAEFTQVYSETYGSDPLNRRRIGIKKRAVPKPVHALYPMATASGNAALPPVTSDNGRRAGSIHGIVSTVVGSALAVKRTWNAAKDMANDGLGQPDRRRERSERLDRERR